MLVILLECIGNSKHSINYCIFYVKGHKYTLIDPKLLMIFLLSWKEIDDCLRILFVNEFGVERGEKESDC